MGKIRKILLTTLSILTIAVGTMGMSSCELIDFEGFFNSSKEEPHTHEMVDRAAQAATCVEAGWQAYEECSVCMHTTYEEIPVLGHHFENGVCSRCEIKTSQNLEFALSADGQSYTVVGIGTCQDAKLVIPETYQGKPVTVIGESAFSENSKLRYVEIPKSVTTIQSLAFYNCVNLADIIIREGVIAIENSAFSSCKKLENIDLPNSITSIAYGAFRDCAKLQSVQLPDNITFFSEDVFEGCDKLQYKEYNKAYYLGNRKNPCLILIKLADPTIRSCTVNNHTKMICPGAFAGCKNLTDVTLGGNVSHIGALAFDDCKSLESVTNFESVTDIGDSAFAGCEVLEELELSNRVTSIGKNAFNRCESLQENENGLSYVGEWLVHCDKSVALATLRDDTKGIADEAFYSCEKLSGIEIPNSLKYIGERAFVYCYKLSSITLGDNVISLGDEAFFDCRKLTSVTLGKGITSIGYSTFRACEALTNVKLPDNLKYIDGFAFNGCNSLASIEIPDSVTFIGDSAFSYCFDLKDVKMSKNVLSIGESCFNTSYALKAIQIPASTVYIGKHAFAYCRDLGSITVDEKNANYQSIEGNLYTKDGKTLLQYACNNSRTSFSIPKGVEIIGEYAFSYSVNLKHIDVSNDVCSIGNYAFDQCPYIMSLVLGKEVTSIGYHAFRYLEDKGSVYYYGTEEDWKKVFIDEYNNNKVHRPTYYSAGEPAAEGDYWHYVDGVPTKW